MIGDDFFHQGDIESSNALGRIAKKMNVGSSVILITCGAGGYYNEGNLLLSNIAKKLHSNVYGPQAEGITNIKMFGGFGPSLQNKKYPAARNILLEEFITTINKL
jgi:hypothetical protein